MAQLAPSSMRDFQILQKLGEGSFSIVYKVRRNLDQCEYALKKVKLPQLKDKERQNALNEVRLLASIDDQYIVAYKDAFIDDSSSSLCIVMELLSGGDLQKRIGQIVKAQYPPFTEMEIWKAMVHMSRGLKSLHDANVVHRDLKCANVFLSQDGKFKLGDLNVSKVAKMGLVYTQTGTPYYASPEVWRDEPYDSKSDVWSLGCVLYEMGALKPPFRASDMDGLFKKVQRGVYDPMPAKYSKDLQEVISQMLKVKSNQRPSCDQILSHPLVQKHIQIHEPLETKAQLLKTIQFPKNWRQLKEKLPQAKYHKEKSTDRATTQQAERYINIGRVKTTRNESPSNKRASTNNLLTSASGSTILLNPPTPANALGGLAGLNGVRPPSISPQHANRLYSRPQSYNPSLYKGVSREYSPNTQVAQKPNLNPITSSADNLNIRQLSQQDIRNSLSILKAKTEQRQQELRARQYVENSSQLSEDPVLRKESGVFPLQAKVLKKDSSYLSVGSKPSRPLSSNIIPDHNISIRQKQLAEYKPQYNMINNAYSHYFPVEHINIRSPSQILKRPPQSARMSNQNSSDSRVKQYKLSELPKLSNRRII